MKIALLKPIRLKASDCCLVRKRNRSKAMKLVDLLQIKTEVHPEQTGPAVARNRVSSDKRKVSPVLLPVSLPNVYVPVKAAGNSARVNGKQCGLWLRRRKCGGRTRRRAELSASSRGSWWWCRSSRRS